jgi:hypothetical protein
VKRPTKVAVGPEGAVKGPATGEFIAPPEVEEKDERADALPQQEEFWRPPVRFDSVPVEREPLGWDRRKGFRKLFPAIYLPFQVVERLSFGHSETDCPPELADALGPVVREHRSSEAERSTRPISQQSRRRPATASVRAGGRAHRRLVVLAAGRRPLHPHSRGHDLALLVAVDGQAVPSPADAVRCPPPGLRATQKSPQQSSAT